MAERIQRKRTRGWRMPDGAIYVGRPSRWGNPIRIIRCGKNGPYDLERDGVGFIGQTTGLEAARRSAADRFRNLVLEHPNLAQPAATIRAELAGHDLVCWCPLNSPCHGDVLLGLANAAGGSND